MANHELCLLSEFLFWFRIFPSYRFHEYSCIFRTTQSTWNLIVACKFDFLFKKKKKKSLRGSEKRQFVNFNIDCRFFLMPIFMSSCISRTAKPIKFLYFGWEKEARKGHYKKTCQVFLKDLMIQLSSRHFFYCSWYNELRAFISCISQKKNKKISGKGWGFLALECTR